MSSSVIVCVPVRPDGQLDPRWGRAGAVAVASIQDGTIVNWDVLPVGWDVLHDAGPEGGHHARVARFLMEHGVQAVVANHMGLPMRQMLERMHLGVHLGASGDAQEAVLLALARPN